MLKVFRGLRNNTIIRHFANQCGNKNIHKVIPKTGEKFGEKLDKSIGDKYLNPTGFLNERGK